MGRFWDVYPNGGEPPFGGPPIVQRDDPYFQIRITSPSLDLITTTVIVCRRVTVTPFLRGWISPMSQWLVGETPETFMPASPE